MGGKYIALAKSSLQGTLAYRGNVATSLASAFVGVMAKYYLWRAVFEGRGTLVGYTWDDMKAYLLVAHASEALLSWYSEIRISQRILTGEITTDLLRPVDFQTARLAESIGSSVVEGGITVFFLGALLVLFSGVPAPPSAVALAAFLVSCVIALLIKFCIIYIFCISCFWTSSSRGVAFARMAVTRLFSGALIPLSFFPGWLRRLSEALPFKGLVHVPANIYLGKIGAYEAWWAIGEQLVWVVVLWWTGRLLYRWGLRRVTIFGG